MEPRAVNSILDAFTTSFGTYVIPLVAYNLVFSNKEATDKMAKKPTVWVNMGWMRALNWSLASLVFFRSRCWWLGLNHKLC
jgi:hypothetical protein